MGHRQKKIPENSPKEFTFDDRYVYIKWGNIDHGLVISFTQ